MRRATRKRSTLANRAIAAAAALLLGGGGLVAVNVYASAGEGHAGKSQQQHTRFAGHHVSTIHCPDVSNQLTDVPPAARPQVDQQLAAIDSQITDAYKRFADRRTQIDQDPAVAKSAVLDPLKAQRLTGLNRIYEALRRAGHRPHRLDNLAPCSMQGDDNGGGQGDPSASPSQDAGDNPSADPSADPSAAPSGDPGTGGGDGGQAGQGGNGPEASDFVDIKSVRPNVRTPRQARGGSKGSFTSNCGRNEEGKHNSDNVIVAPGVTNGAHHVHDYVGNKANDAFASDDAFAAGETTCSNPGDKSTYYWPVVRLQNGVAEDDANADGGGKEGNAGEIQTPAQASIKFVGSPVAKVTAMPRFLRIITGDAKAFTNGDANANASWSCTGFENRQLKDKYPICPQGSKVVRTFKFQSCWDGQNTDSANHRTHVAFADQNGRCAAGFKAIPQLQQRIVYDVPPGPGFALDSFPEQLHKPITDHGDFINVFDEALMNRMVSCINGGRSCR